MLILRGATSAQSKAGSNRLMTCVEAWSALTNAVVHLSRIPGLSWARKLQHILLKAVAIVGYHWGKLTTLDAPPIQAGPCPAVTQQSG